MPEYAKWNIPIPIGDNNEVEYLSLTPTYIDAFNFISGIVYPSQSGESFLAGAKSYF